MGQHNHKPPQVPITEGELGHTDVTTTELVDGTHVTTTDVTVPSPVLERGWLNIAFTGFQPDDSEASLFRTWHGHLVAVRSDNEVIHIRIKIKHTDQPAEFGGRLQQYLRWLETFRNCDCKTRSDCGLVRCDFHQIKMEDYLQSNEPQPL
jgi:hypothetical protein